MTKYTVYKILTIDGRSLLLINQGEKFSFAVYDEHTENTLLRLADPTIESLERAIEILKGKDRSDF